MYGASLAQMNIIFFLIYRGIEFSFTEAANVCFYSSPQQTNQTLSKQDLCCDLAKLDHDAAAELDAKITLDEVKATKVQFPNNKAPGPDGFGAEFYKAYRTLLAPFILRMFKCIREVGSLTNTLYQGNIAPLLKNDQDPTNISSYVSLLLLETKLLSKILANHLNSYIPRIIHPDQTGFIPNQHIYFNMRRLFNILYSPLCDREESSVSIYLCAGSGPSSLLYTL